MFPSVLKTVLFGVTAGVFLFAVPFFLFKLLFFFLFAGLVLRILSVRRARRWHTHNHFYERSGYGPGSAYREMKEGLRDTFKQQPQNI